MTPEELKAKYNTAAKKRADSVNAILESTADKKVVVAGPGTGKTFLFKKILKGKNRTLTLSFVNSLVDDLSLELYGISEVRTLHSFGRSELSKILTKKINIYSKLSTIIRQDFKILNGADIDFDILSRNITIQSIMTNNLFVGQSAIIN
ncbi:MAG: hypothetical protein J7L86_01905, partial [Candidatus Marinimicrobia bacterium]|nr:hypothetical protein [Candidatus Neomarinimicrobiota bacterium]